MNTPSRPPGLSKYQHVATVLRARIRTGDYEPGGPMPTEPQLVDEFGYDRSTIRRGLALLRHEGLITSEQGRGVYVRQAQTVRHELLQVLKSEYEHSKAGKTPNRGLFELNTGVRDDALSVSHTYESVRADDDLAEAFRIDPATELLMRRYRFTVNGEPHELSRSYLLYEQVADTHLADPANERPGQGTLLQLRSVGVHVDYVSTDINSRMPTPDESAELHIPDGTPLFVRRTRSLAEGQVVAVSDTFIPADRVTYAVDVDLKRS